MVRKFFQKFGALALVFVTILWLSLALHFLFLSAGPGVSSPLGETIGAWLQLPCLKPADQQAIYVIGCLEANEAGDYLAGFFAPLAFLWLAAAVFIQSRELREQRRELALTRREFELNREVAAEQAEAARAQAAEARRSADAFERQTRYSDTQRRLMEQEAADQELKALIAPIRALHQRIQRSSSTFGIKDDMSYALHHGREFGGVLARRLEALTAEKRAGTLSGRDQQDYEAIKGCASVAAKLFEKMSAAGRLQFEILGLGHLQASHWFADIDDLGDDNSNAT